MVKLETIEFEPSDENRILFFLEKTGLSFDQFSEILGLPKHFIYCEKDKTFKYNHIAADSDNKKIYFSEDKREFMCLLNNAHTGLIFEYELHFLLIDSGFSIKQLSDISEISIKRFSVISKNFRLVKPDEVLQLSEFYSDLVSAKNYKFSRTGLKNSRSKASVELRAISECIEKLLSFFKNLEVLEKYSNIKKDILEKALLLKNTEKIKYSDLKKVREFYERFMNIETYF